jgi:hypothetical protein
MAVQYAFGQIVTNGLVLALDAADRNSYISGSATWNDLSGNGSNGILRQSGSSALPSYSGSNNGVLYFDGVGSHTTSSISSNITSGTISVWIYPSSNASNNFFAWSDSSTPISAYSHQLGINTSNKLVAYVYDQGTTTSKSFNGAATLSLNTWYNVIFQWVDGAGNTGNFRSYINGVQDGSLALTTAWKSGTSFWLGHRSGFGTLNAPFNGTISNTQIYNRALSASEILQNYNAQRARFGL